MTPDQICVLLVVLLGGSAGAPLARAAPAPAPAPGRVLHQMIADRLGGAPGAAAATEPLPPPPGQAEPDRTAAEYDYDYYVYEYEDVPAETLDVPADGGGEAEDRGLVTLRALAAAAESSPVERGDAPSSTLAPPRREETATTTEAALSKRTTSSPVVSSTATAQVDDVTSRVQNVLKDQAPTSTSTAAPETSSTLTTSTKSPQTTTKSIRKLPLSSLQPIALENISEEENEVPLVKPESNEIDFEVSESNKVLAYQLRAANLDSPDRESPQFFVPPIVRRNYRRRVSLTGGGRRSNQPSLGDKLAEQVRQQLAELQRQESETLGLSSAQAAQPVQHVQHVPTGRREPAYRHPFIPTPPTTTATPYKHPFIPTPPSTTARPFRHPFIPTPPPTRAAPYRHPFVPVPPESTAEPAAAPAAEPAEEAVRPQARRVGGGPSPLGSVLAAGRTPAATIVHQETLQEGFIVGEYGEVHRGGTVRGVKYAADSSVDRRLLEAALAQFLRL